MLSEHEIVVFCILRKTSFALTPTSFFIVTALKFHWPPSWHINDKNYNTCRCYTGIASTTRTAEDRTWLSPPHSSFRYPPPTDNSGPARGGSGIPIYALFCPQDTNIPQNRKMCDTKYLLLFWNRILNTRKWTSQILIKEKLLVLCPLPLPLRSASVHGDRILVTLSINALCKRFFISFIVRAGVSGSVHQGQEQIILPLIYLNSFIVNNCNAAYNPFMPSFGMTCSSPEVVNRRGSTTSWV